MLDKNYIVPYKVFEGDTLLHQGEIPLALVVGGRGGDSSLDGMWNPEWHLYEKDYPGCNRRVEVYINNKVMVLQDNASFDKQ